MAKLLGLGIGGGLLGGQSTRAATPKNVGSPNVPTDLDHVVWAVPDLDEGIAQITELTGVKPVSGGTAPGRSLPHNALLSLGDGRYFEIFCPARAGGSTWGPLVADGKPHIASYALHVSDRFESLLKRLPITGLTHTGPHAMGRVRPDGSALNWELLNLAGSPSDGSLPFFIDWLGSKPHPSESSPSGLKIEALLVADPQADVLSAIYRQIGLDISIVRSDKRSINIYVDTPKGKVFLS